MKTDICSTCDTCFGSNYTCPKVQLYHDLEWGKCPSSDALLYERLCLYIFQAGLNIRVVLLKREALKRAFSNYDLQAVALLTKRDIKALMLNEQIIRNSKKLEAVVHNAQCAALIRKEYGSLHLYLEQFRNILAPHNALWSTCSSYDELPCESKESRYISYLLKQKGMKRIGPKTVYSFLQSIGLITSHIEGCTVR